jgi:transposase
MSEQLPRVAPNHRITGPQRAEVGRELLRRYQAGRSIRELCAETGYSIGRVRQLLQEAGVTYRRRGGRRPQGGRPQQA